MFEEGGLLCEELVVEIAAENAFDVEDAELLGYEGTDFFRELG